jgi:arylsulfatase A-like enzyme
VSRGRHGRSPRRRRASPLWTAPAAAALLCVAVAPGCTCQHPSDVGAAPAPLVTATATDDASAATARPAVIDFVRDLDRCALGHRGVLLDFGDPMTRANLHPGSIARSTDELVEHEGATWLRVRARAVTASFYWPPPTSDVPEGGAYVEGRVRGVTARGAAVLLDGKPAGSWALGKGETRILVARALVAPTLTPGEHELSLRFIGGPRGGDEPVAEIDWVHVGTGEPTEPYAAPTRRDVVVDTTVGGRSLRALSLRAPGSVRCSGWLPADATLEASLATVGGGEADVEGRLLRDRHAPVVLGTAHVAGGSVAWAPWSVPLTGLEGDGALGSLELVVKRATRGTRVLLGEPRLVVTGSAVTPAPRPARSVVVVVLGSTSARSLAPWGGPHAAPELSKLAAAGVTFTANRAVSSLASADVGAMLTGLPPSVLGLDDPDARLPHGPTTLEEALRQGGVSTAMFTANPTTGAAFGFDRGWDTFVAHDPLDTTLATQVFDDAATWIEAHKADRFAVVVHARGGHPPWDASAEDLKTMPPEGYLGVVEPQRAAEALAKSRKHPTRLKDDDRARAWALYDRAVDAHDAALGRLLAAIRTADREDDTAVIVVGDVAATEGPPLPFVDVDGIEESILATPLVVRWPQGPLAGRRVDAPTGPLDVGRTALAALGLAAPEAFRGADLASLARGAIVPAQRPQAATRAGHFSVRWGTLVLLGARDRETRLCDVALDPTCVADIRATTPLALEPMHRWTLDALSASPARYPREPAVLDARTLSGLVRWGRPTDDRATDSN